MLCVATTAAASEGIREDLRRYFSEPDFGKRAALAKRIAADPEFRWSRLAQWLPSAPTRPDYAPGRRTIQIALPDDDSRECVLRIPAGYDAAEPWPLIYGLHGQGGHARWTIGYLEHILGPRVDDYLIAAPTDYRGRRIDGVSETPEHRILLLALKRRLNVDSDRVYATGYSMGGHTSWTIAATLGEQFAGVMPLAGSLIFPAWDLKDHFLPSVAATHVLAVWGELDHLNAKHERSSTGGIAGNNRDTLRRVEQLGLTDRILGIELPGVGHGGVRPPAFEMRKLFERRRVAPDRVTRIYRTLEDGCTAWIEPVEWLGASLDGGRIRLKLQDGESSASRSDVERAAVRAYMQRLASYTAERDGNAIRVTQRRKLRSMVIWIGDEVDWAKPITLTVSRRTAFDAVLQPDLHLCLEQARRTYDFQRLRRAGLHYHSRRGVTVLSGGDVSSLLRDWEREAAAARVTRP